MITVVCAHVTVLALYGNPERKTIKRCVKSADLGDQKRNDRSREHLISLRPAAETSIRRGTGGQAYAGATNRGSDDRAARSVVTRAVPRRSP